jgi:hypothetical protein
VPVVQGAPELLARPMGIPAARPRADRNGHRPS